MKKSEKILLGVLSIVITFFVLDTFILGSDKKRDPKNSGSTGLDISGESTDPSQRKAGRVNQASFNPDLFTKWKRDPFLGAFTAELIDSLQGNIPYVLKAIAWRGKEAHVLINDDIYQLGVPKNGFLVSQVLDSTVVLSRDGERYILTLGEKNE